MGVIDSLRDIYDKMPLSESDDAWVVKEQDKGATFNKLDIQNCGGKFYVIDNSAYKKLDDMITRNSTFLQDEDCDGVASTNVKGNTNFVMAELKSNLASEKIQKAYKQIVFTYLKLFMMMSICQNTDVGKYEIMGIIACHPPKDTDQEDFLKLQYLNIEEIAPDIKCLVKLYYEGKIECEFGKIYFIKDKKLPDFLKNKKFTLYLKTSDTPKSPSASFDLTSLT